MHDLIHDLARDVAGENCIIWEDETQVPNAKEVRHVSFADVGEPVPYEHLHPLCGLSNLRTLELYSLSLVDNFFSHFRYLRVITVTIGGGGCPSSIGKLKHLRFLRIISENIHTLPKCVINLHCLEVLSLDCPKLTELPSDIEKMVNLRYIHLHEEAPLSQMPSGLRKLTSLRELSSFFVGKDTGCKLKDLHGLIHLQGSMRIKNLENMSSAESAKANFREKQIRNLQLSWNEENSSHSHVEVLEALEPHKNVEALKVSGYGGVEFPRWLMESSFPKIRSIVLNRCKKCQHLPPFWKLPSLKMLILDNMHALRSMESREERGEQVWFPSLRLLYLTDVPKLESLTPRAVAAAANNNIEELKGGLVSFPFLEELILDCCNEKLVHSLLVVGKDNPSSSSLAKLLTLRIRFCNDLEALPEGALQSSTSLQELALSYCRNLVIDSNSLSTEILTSLEELAFAFLPKLVSLPEGIQKAAKLQKLSMYNCAGLMNLPDWMGNLTSLRSLSIYDFPQLKFLPDGMQQLTALETLGIRGCTGLTSWPNWLWSFTSLRSIQISCTPNLPALPEQLQMLTCLRCLNIVTNNVLTSLPEWMVNLTWLQKLYIRNCGEHLKARCEKDKGEDWPKISHIPKIEINDITIQDK